MIRLLSLFGNRWRTLATLCIPIIGSNYCLQYNRKPSLNGWTQLATRSAHLVDKKKSIDDIYNEISKCVVNITILRKDNAGDPEEYGKGTGFITDSRGLVVTNCHVAQESTLLFAEIFAKIDDNFVAVNTLSGRVVYVEPEHDLAVIRLDRDPNKPDQELNLPVISYTDRTGGTAGEHVMVICCENVTAPALIDGIIICADREGTDMSLGNFAYIEYLSDPMGRYITHSCRVAGGSSGGPMADMSGNVMAVNFGSLEDYVKVATIGDRARGLNERAVVFERENSHRQHLYSEPMSLGVIVHEFGEHVRQFLGPEIIEYLYDDFANEPGIFVWRTLMTRVPHDNDFKKFDLIVRIDGNDVNTYREFVNEIRGKNDFTATIIRGGEPMQLDITREPINCYFM